MKTFKKILAWLDWSNYAKNDYELPKSLCPLFWRTFFGILVLPLAYPTHIWNLFQKPDYNRRYQSDSKMHMGVGILLHFITLLAGAMGGRKIIEQELSFDWLTWSDPFLLGYGKVFITGIATIASIILMAITIFAIFAAIWEGLKWLWEKITDVEVEYREVLDENGNNNGYERVYSPFIMSIKKAYKAIKNKYCPTIDWSEIKK